MSSDDLSDIEAISPTTIFVSGQAVTEAEAFDAIDTVLSELSDTNDLENVDKTEDTLLGLQRISGKALAKLLYGKHQWWIATGQDEQRNDTFEDYEITRHGLKATTVDRYITVWDKIQSGEMPKKLLGKPMRDLIPIAKALAQDYEISKDVWGRLIKATSNAEVLRIVREDIKGSKPRKSSMRLYIERDGSIVAWKENKRYHVGFLDINSDEKIVQKAITRIVGSTGIMKR